MIPRTDPARTEPEQVRLEPTRPRPCTVSISPRENEIIRLVAAGYPNKTIAGVLDISPWTVATHIRRLFDKLRVHSRAELIARLVIKGYRFDEDEPR